MGGGGGDGGGGGGVGRGSGAVRGLEFKSKVRCLFVCLFSLLLNVPFHTLVYFRDVSYLLTYLLMPIAPSGA